MTCAAGVRSTLWWHSISSTGQLKFCFWAGRRHFRFIRYLVGAHRPGRQYHARMPATNAKPRDEFAGLHRFATCRGLFSSRHRDACRPVVTGLSVVLSELSSIGPLSIQDFTRRVVLPTGMQVRRLASRPLCVPVPRLGIVLLETPLNAPRAFSPPLRFSSAA